MKAYVIAMVEVADDAAYDTYRQQTPAVIESIGGRFLVRGGPIEMREGELDFSRLVVLEFPSMAQARAFYDSEAYQRILPIRTENARSRLLIVEGYGPPA